MNRRRFIQSLVAVSAVPVAPALSLRTATAAIPIATAVPAKARFWAIYISALHGECTPETLQNLLHIPPVDAKSYIAKLITEGVIKPNPLLQKSATNLVKNNERGLREKIQDRLDMKAKAKPQEAEVTDTAEVTDPTEDSIDDTQSLESASELEPEIEPGGEEEHLEFETQVPVEADIQNDHACAPKNSNDAQASPNSK